ncbi:MAG: beta-lactamase family protein, partial [Flavobacteriales bacterium]|nr:beta-lactamase family protein [Flavobacteriales bacterium]
INAQSIKTTGLKEKIDALIPEAINDTTPGLVIGIVHEGELIFKKAYGKANLAYGLDNDSKMVYNIGSVSKQFLGYAFAMLEVDGSLDLDNPVSKYLDDWPEFDHEVTLRHVLTHTSGYREAYTLSNLAGRIVGVDHLSREECLNVVRKQPELEFTPGSRFTYNSTAWVILAEVFEKVKGESAEDWLVSNVLRPLGMNDTHIETHVGEVIPNAAESYYLNDENSYVNAESNRAIFGAAEVYSSIEDLAKWVNNYKTAEIGGKKVRDLFVDPFTLNNGRDAQYGLGIFSGNYRGLKRIQHGGSHEAFLSFISYYPDQDLGIITITNFGGKGWTSESDIADILLGEFISSEPKKMAKGKKSKKKKLEQFTGLYLVSDKNRKLDFSVEDDSLTINGRTKLVPIDKNRFRNKSGDNTYSFELSDDGRARLTEKTSRVDYIYDRIEPWESGAEGLKDYVGDYWSTELETVYHLTIEEDAMRVEHRWLGEIGLQPLSKDIFRSEWGQYVEFLRDEKGLVTGLSINTGRTLNVRFDKMD